MVVDDRLDLDDRRPPLRAAVRARRRDDRLARGVAARRPHRLHRQHVRRAVRARPEPRHDAGRPLPRPARLRRVGRPHHRPRARAAAHRPLRPGGRRRPHRRGAHGATRRDGLGPRPCGRRHGGRHRRRTPSCATSCSRPLRRRRGVREDELERPRDLGAVRGLVPPPLHHRALPGAADRGRAATSSPRPAPAPCSPRPGPTSPPVARSRRCTSPTSCSRPEPAPPAARAVAADATRALLDVSTNFWEAAWLRRSIDRLERTP